MMGTRGYQYLEKVAADPKMTAKAIGLRYVLDNIPGITRRKFGKKFRYFDQNGQPLKDHSVIKRIKSLVLPPAWLNVWICPFAEGHLQATGIDQKNRKQYKYHPEWVRIRNQTKYFRMLQFGTMLPLIRARVEKDLAQHGLPLTKVLAIIVSVMERTFIRIGNASYEKLYGSYGLTTLHDEHVKIHGSSIIFEFKGKKGVHQQVELVSPKLARLVKRCKDIPGYELFQYIDENGDNKKIDSGEVNNYLKEITGFDFTAKDFRTWAGSVNALKAFHIVGEAETQNEIKKNIVKVIDAVSGLLGNTRAVCKKYYIHPAIINAYESGCLKDYTKELDEIEKNDEESGLTCEEKIVMKMLGTMKIQDVLQ